MNFPNATKGINKIFVSEIISAIATLLGFIMNYSFSINTYFFETDPVSFNPASGILSLVSGTLFFVMMILSVIFGLIGYIRASKDEADFRKAMFCTGAMVVLTLIASFVRIPSQTMYTIFNSAATIVEMFAMIFAISALINLAEASSRHDMVDLGNRVMRILFISYVAAAFNILIIRTFERSSKAQVVALVVAVIDIVIALLQHLLFLYYLSKTKKMLNGSMEPHRGIEDE
ncbi:MAG: hypothetical protein IJ598_05995 [Ruminococcus sp.]|nr:hypothetical protein [Ruminococcus sp.]